ncbi:MAG: cellulase family glycosylhydrolase [Pseudolysinimonas sp.]
MMSLYSLGDRFLRDPAHRTHVPCGVHYVPVSGPDWPWRTDASEFARAFEAIAAAGLNAVRFDVIWAAVELAPRQYDENHLVELDRIFDAAEACGLSLHPTLFVGGEVGDAYWDLPWARGRNPHVDAELLEIQAEHAAMLARRWRHRSGLLAWDLTDEPPFWIYADDTSDDDARRWTRAVVDAIRSEDPDHLITIGTASQEIDHGPFRADVVAELLDFACVHPYPIYSPELYPDRLRSRRMTESAAFEVALARGAGREVMLHEYGASSAQFAPAAIADYDRLLAATAFGAGAIGFYAWCWTDAETAAYYRAPYSRMPHETQFGLVDQFGTGRPRLAALQELQSALGDMDLDGLAADGPVIDAEMPVPHEYSSPYDREGYRLGVDSPYTPAEQAWQPERSVKPLIRGLLNGYVMAARSGMSVGFPRERVSSSSAAPIILAPAPLSSTTTSLLHVEPEFWTDALARVTAGAVLYLSLSSESAIPELVHLAGVEIVDRAPVHDELRITFTANCGDVKSGAVVAMPDGQSDPHLRGVELAVFDAEVVALTADGRPAITVARRGSGSVVVCAHPIELLRAEFADAHESDDLSWLVYRAVAGLGGRAREHHPATSRQDLRGPHGGVSVVANHSGEPVDVQVEAPWAGTGQSPVVLTVGPYGFAIHPWAT